MILFLPLLYCRYLIWANTKIRPKEGINLDELELKIFKKYATSIVFPLVNKSLLLILHIVWVISLICAGISFSDGQPLFFFIFVSFIVMSFVTIPRLSPDFLFKNVKRGVESQEEEFLVFKSVLHKCDRSCLFFE